MLVVLPMKSSKSAWLRSQVAENAYHDRVTKDCRSRILFIRKLGDKVTADRCVLSELQL